MKLLKLIIIIFILLGIVIGTYTAIIDQLPDVTGKVTGTTNITTNQTLGTVCIDGKFQKSSENLTISLIVTKTTKIYKEKTDGSLEEVTVDDITTGDDLEVDIEGKPTDTLPPQVISTKITIKNKEQK
ncbi:MAG: hypothetical protein Q4Q23_01020 [Methanobacteriaceae archaeon]|nr:hypothetical protein [Methanobacteriaceae archaeon]